GVGGGGGPGPDPARGRGGGGVLLRRLQVFLGVERAGGVVDAQPGDLALAPRAQDQLVGGGGDPLLLHAQGGQLVDVEEPPVVDLVGGDAPEGQAVGPLAGAGVEDGAAVGGAGLAAEGGSGVRGERADRRRRTRARLAPA